MKTYTLPALMLLIVGVNCGDDKSADSISGSDGVGQLSQLIDEGSDPTVSPAGDWVAYRSTAGIYKRPVAGGQPVKLFDYGLEPDWSWLHNLILVRAGGIVVFDPDTGDIVRTLAVDYDDGPCWSPLGDEIAAQEDGVLIVSYPDGDTSSIQCTDTLDGGCEGEYPSWSPDGQWLVFEDGIEILKVPRSGGTATPVVYGLRDVSHPVWSPDGRWIAFMMADSASQNVHIWLTDPRGVDFGLTQLTSGDYFDHSPAWSPDSRYLHFARSSVDSTYFTTPVGIWRVKVKP